MIKIDKELKTITIEGCCVFCMSKYKITTEYTDEKIDYLYGKSDKKIQDVFKHESIETRETILSGICEKCQSEIFGDKK